MKRTEAGVEKEAEEVGLPLRSFLYTLDQVAYVLSIPEKKLKAGFIHYTGVTAGASRKHLIAARNIAQPGQQPDWRVAETELIRWMKLKGFRYRVNGRIVD